VVPWLPLTVCAGLPGLLAGCGEAELEVGSDGGGGGDWFVVPEVLELVEAGSPVLAVAAGVVPLGLVVGEVGVVGQLTDAPGVGDGLLMVAGMGFAVVVPTHCVPGPAA
jgi:hypothetical protein